MQAGGIGSGGTSWSQGSAPAPHAPHMRPAPPSRPWSAARPTSARARKPAPAASATYGVDPFGDEEAPAAARPTPMPPTGGLDRLQQQKALQQQRRANRTMGGVVAAPTTLRPGGVAPRPPMGGMGVGAPRIGGTQSDAIAAQMDGVSLSGGSSSGGMGGGGAFAATTTSAFGDAPQTQMPQAVWGDSSRGSAPSGELRGFVRDRHAAMGQVDDAGLETVEAEGGAASSAPGSRAREVEQEMLSQGMAQVYDPAAQQGDEAATAPAPSTSVNAAPRAAAVDLSDLRAFLMQPGPAEGQIQCTIRRTRNEKGASKSFPTYLLYLEPQSGRTELTFLLAGRKRRKSGGANYMVSLDEEDQARDSGNYFGKVRSNFMGTQFVCYDKGANPKKADDTLNVSQFGARQELAVVNYQYNVLGMRGPRKMTVGVPSVDANGRRALFKPDQKGKGSLADAMSGGDQNNLIVMTNKAPKWNEKEGAWCLNFNGRVSKASVKNFQLVAEDNQEHIILQFGKTGEDTFTMDYAWPMNALQAFTICLSSFDSKLACE